MNSMRLSLRSLWKQYRLLSPPWLTGHDCAQIYERRQTTECAPFDYVDLVLRQIPLHTCELFNGGIALLQNVYKYSQRSERR